MKQPQPKCSTPDHPQRGKRINRQGTFHDSSDEEEDAPPPSQTPKEIDLPQLKKTLAKNTRARASTLTKQPSGEEDSKDNATIAVKSGVGKSRSLAAYGNSINPVKTQMASVQPEPRLPLVTPTGSCLQMKQPLNERLDEPDTGLPEALATVSQTTQPPNPLFVSQRSLRSHSRNVKSHRADDAKLGNGSRGSMNAPRRSAFPRTVSAFLENKSSRSRHGRNALITGSTAQTKATHTKSSSLTSREKESVAGQVARTSSIPMAGIQPNIFQETQAKRSRVSSVQVVIKKKRKAEDTEGQENAAKKVASHLRFRASKKLANTEILNDKATISQECTGQMSKPSVANAMVVSRPNTTNGSEGIKESGLPKVQPLPKSDVMNTEICKEAGLVSIPGLGSKHSGQVVDKPTERPPAKSGGTIEETVSAAPSFPKYPTRPPVVGYSTAFEERNSIVSSKNTDAQSSAPLFLYSIYQKVYTETDDATKTPATQIINRSFTNIGDANVQAERLVSFAQQCQNLHNIQFRTQNMHHDENNCVSFTGIFSNVDGEVIGRKNYLNIWVQREISHEDHRALDEGTQFINNTLYILRLCKLTYPEANEEISPPSCLRATSALVPTREPLLSYISLSSQCFRQLGIFSELYTIKDSANHAARKLQLALSHQPDPMSIEMRKWQDSEHSRLAQKLLDLEKAKLSISARDNGGVDAPSLASTENGDGKSSEKKSEQEGCWWSEFNGLDGERYRLIVENIEVNGPRNI